MSVQLKEKSLEDQAKDELKWIQREYVPIYDELDAQFRLWLKERIKLEARWAPVLEGILEKTGIHRFNLPDMEPVTISRVYPLRFISGPSDTLYKIDAYVAGREFVRKSEDTLVSWPGLAKPKPEVLAELERRKNEIDRIRADLSLPPGITVEFRGRWVGYAEVDRAYIKDLNNFVDRWQDTLREKANCDPVMEENFEIVFKRYRPEHTAAVRDPSKRQVIAALKSETGDFVNGQCTSPRYRLARSGSSEHRQVMKAIRELDSIRRHFKLGNAYDNKWEMPEVEWCKRFQSAEEAQTWWGERWSFLHRKIAAEQRDIWLGIPFRLKLRSSGSAYQLQRLQIRGGRAVEEMTWQENMAGENFNNPGPRPRTGPTREDDRQRLFPRGSGGRRKETFKFTANFVRSRHADEYEAIKTALHPRHKRMFEMYFEQNIPQAEIAWRMGYADASHVSRIISQIKGRFRDRGLPMPVGDVYRSSRGIPAENLDDNDHLPRRSKK